MRQVTTNLHPYRITTAGKHIPLFNQYHGASIMSIILGTKLIAMRKNNNNQTSKTSHSLWSFDSIRIRMNRKSKICSTLEDHRCYEWGVRVTVFSLPVYPSVNTNSIPFTLKSVQIWTKVYLSILTMERKFSISEINSASEK